MVAIRASIINARHSPRKTYSPNRRKNFRAVPFSKAWKNPRIFFQGLEKFP
jgi:hypothetical protein